MAENRLRNEKEIILGEVKILLRPNFQNIAALESDLGSISYLSYKFGKGYDLVTQKINMELASKHAPSMIETTKIIFHCQADKHFTLEEIYDLVLARGIAVCMEIIGFVAQIAAGNQNTKELTPRQKKNTVNKSQVES